jgi:hypothetical protein
VQAQGRSIFTILSRPPLTSIVRFPLPQVIDDRRIGRVELVTTGDWGEYGCEADFDSVEIEKIQQVVPQAVIEAFDRHIWYSQHSLSNIFAFKIPVEGQDTYALAISGIAGDGWDNSGHFLEIFDGAGRCVGSTMICEYKKPVWWDRTIDGDDFHTSAPKWTGNPISASDEYTQWSEQMPVSIQQDGNITRIVLFAPE